MTIEIRICKPVDDESAEWVHYCYVSNPNRAMQILQELFMKEQQTNGTRAANN